MRSRPRLAPAAALLAASLALAACGGGGGSSGPITVSGTVVSSSGAPVSGISVVLDEDMSNVVTTSSAGAFSFTKVTPPYTLTVASGTTITEYQQLSRAAPQVVVGAAQVGYTASVSGAVTGPSYPLPSGEGILLGATNGVLTTTTPDKTTGLFSGASFDWSGASSVTTDVAALLGSASGGVITAYYDMGKVTGVTLQNGMTVSGLSIALDTPVTTTTTTFHYDVGAYTVDPSATYVSLTAGGAQFFLPGSLAIPDGASLLLPDGGGTLGVSGHDANGNEAVRIGTANLGGTTTLDLPAATALANGQPAQGATGVSKTPVLSWTPVAGTSLYLVTLSGSGLEYNYVLPGGVSSLSVPDYSALGLPLAGTTSYSFTVSSVTLSGLSPDALTDPAVGGIGEVTLLRAGDLTFFSTGQSSFTTGP